MTTVNIKQLISTSLPVGFTGSAGAGFTGSRGFTGPSGPLGPLGYTGSQGVGFTGSQGDIGFTGSLGGFESTQQITFVTDLIYTLSAADIGKLLAFNNTLDAEIIIPNDTAINFNIGQRFDITQYNTGAVVVEAGAGVSLYAPLDAFLNEQYSVASVIKIGANQWIFVGPQSAGYTGSQGPQGFTGSQGDVGFIGSQGVQGFTGSIGGFNSTQELKSVALENYTLVTSDAGKLLLLSNPEEDEITVTVPINDSTPWAVGQRVDLKQTGFAPINIIAATGVTILSNGESRLFNKDSVATLVKIATDQWVFVGPQSGYTGSQGFTGSTGFTGSVGPFGTRDIYTFGGNRSPEAGTTKIPYLRVSANTTCVDASLTARVPPSGGSFVVAIERSSNNGITFPDTVATVTLGENNIVAVASTTVSLSAGNLLRLNIASVNGAQDWACQLRTEST
jgi:hypothetical protein